MYKGSKKHLQNLANARKLASELKEECKICNKYFSKSGIVNHTKSCKNRKTCPVCGKLFTGKSTTCGHSCANTFFRSGKDHPNYGSDHYRRICFDHHKKECVVCGESNIVEVHHYNEDHYDNRPENLVPLCPTHHQYWHSGYKYAIENIVDSYVESFHTDQYTQSSSVVEHCLYTADVESSILSSVTINKE